MKKYSLGLYEKSMPNSLSWLEKLQIAKDSGYDSVEISIDETDAKLERLYNFELAKEIKNAILAVGLPVKTMCLSGHRRFPLGSHDQNIRDKSLDIFYRAVDLADYLGVRIIQLAGYDVYYEESDAETVALFNQNLAKGIEYAASKAIVCGFETMEIPFMNTIEKALNVCKHINNPYCLIYPDLGNITNAAIADHKNVLDDIKMGAGYMVAAHLKETKPGIFREVEFGEGHVDFENGIKALWENGVRFFGVEFWYSDKTDYRERLTHNRDFVKKYLDRME